MALLSILAWTVPAGAADALAEAGRQIYEKGQLASGAPLRATGGGNIRLEGEAAACIQCHRASGMGAFEGGNLVPPVSGPALFGPRTTYGMEPRRAAGITARDYHFRSRPAYDSTSLAKALRTGTGPAGGRFSPLMPRYELSDRDMVKLEAYLRQLSVQASPGIEGNVAHFATVFTPTANPVDRQGVIDVLNQCFRERQPPGRAAGMAWRLHVVDLRGDPADWGRQLSGFLAERPVFALVSGAGTADWAPVHQFCEAAALPCLFPNVDAPGARQPGRYNFYFSAGTVLEGEVIAHWLSRERPARVIQVFAETNLAARAGAKALSSSPAAAKAAMASRPLANFSPSALAAALADIGPADLLVLWLTRGELAAVTAALPTPPDASRIVASGWLGDIEGLSIDAAWRQRLHLVYPFDPPARRDLRMRFNLRPWLGSRGIAPAKEMILGNTLAACKLLTEGMAAMRGLPLRDYLVEMIENYPSGMGNAPAPQAFYSFSLGPGQRYSSKGAFMVRFAEGDGQRLEPVSGWIVP